MIVTLNWNECYIAASVGVKRHMENLEKKAKARYNYNPEDVWDSDIETSAGEMASAKALGLYWEAIAGFGVESDLAEGIEVKTVKEGKKLIIPFDMPDDSKVVVARGKIPTFDIVGWYYAGEAKKEEWKRKPYENRPAYYLVPDEELRPLKTIFDD